MAGMRVLGADEVDGELKVTVETIDPDGWCRGCGVKARSKGRRDTLVRDVAAFDRPVRLRWRKRRWRCPERLCPVKTWTEAHKAVAARRCGPTGRSGRRAAVWAATTRPSIMTVSGAAWCAAQQGANISSTRFACVKTVGLALHNANRHHSVDGPAITVSPMHATLADSRPSCRDAILDAIARLHMRAGATVFARKAIVAEVREATGAGFERQTIYRCLRRMAGREPGSAHVDLEDLGNNRLHLRA